jgi:hypothetical protein
MYSDCALGGRGMSRLGIELVGLMPKLEVNGFELGLRIPGFRGPLNVRLVVSNADACYRYSSLCLGRGNEGGLVVVGGV